MLAILVKFIHFLVCLGLVIVVLLQADKGEGLAGAFGGGASNTLFGERGAAGPMAKITTGMAIVFMFTSLILSVFLPYLEGTSSMSPRTVQTSGSTRSPVESDMPAPAGAALPGATALPGTAVPPAGGK
ncbi:MAG: preprotein translocase subunit SecG [Candidatus Ozemobacteraceae bacterium]